MTEVAAPCRCGKPVTDGFLCHVCSRLLSEYLRIAPALYDDLGTVLAKQAHYSDFIGRSGQVNPLPINLMALRARQRLHKAIRAASENTGGPINGLGYTAAWLRRNLDGLRRVLSAGHHFEAIEAAVIDAQRVADRPPDRWYAGRCEKCGRDLYPEVETKHVECLCGQSWAVETKRTQLLDQLHDVVAPGPTIARALSTITTEPVTPERLRKWRHEGRLVVREFRNATNYYRVGDVLGLLADDARRKARREARRHA